MSLQRAKELVDEAGRIVADEGLNSPEYGEFFFEALAGLILTKKSLKKIIDERRGKELRSEGNKGMWDAYNELLYGKKPDQLFGIPGTTPITGNTAYCSADSQPVSGGSGVDLGNNGAVPVPGSQETHDQKPSE